MATAYMRLGGVWVPSGLVEDPGGGGEEPPPPPPPPPSGITHGEEIPALSANAESFLSVPAPNTLPTISGPFSGTQTIEGRQIDGQARILAGARIIFRNCVFLGQAGASGANYTLRNNDGGGAWVTLENCLLITRTGVGNVTKGTKTMVMWGDTNLEVRQCVVRGGLDGLYAAPSNSPGLIPTGDSIVPNARVLVEECWFGDNERVGAGHADLTQAQGIDFGHILIRRSRYMAFTIPIGSDTLTNRVTNPDTNTMASTCFISTVSGTDISNKHHIVLKDSWFDGGNYVTQANSDDASPMVLSGNKYGLRHQYGPRSGAWSTTENCRWGKTGTTGTGLQVTAGDLIPGSSA